MMLAVEFVRLQEDSFDCFVVLGHSGSIVMGLEEDSYWIHSLLKMDLRVLEVDELGWDSFVDVEIRSKTGH